MQNLDIQSAVLHSFLTQSARTKAIGMFKNQKVPILITTDIAARGIDVKTVDLVINYDLPRDHKDFVHRVGRTARGGRVGLAISLVTQYDTNRIKAIEAGIGGEEMRAQEFNEDEALKGSSAVIKAKKKAEVDIVSKGEEETFDKIRDRKHKFREMLLKRKGEISKMVLKNGELEPTFS